MTTPIKVAPGTLLGAGGLSVLLGLIIWTGHADSLISFDESVGWLFVLSLTSRQQISIRTPVPDRH